MDKFILHILNPLLLLSLTVTRVNPQRKRVPGFIARTPLPLLPSTLSNGNSQ